MIKVDNIDILAFLEKISMKVDKIKFNHVMKSSENYVLYYYRKKSEGGYYTTRISIESVESGMKNK